MIDKAKGICHNPKNVIDKNQLDFRSKKKKRYSHSKSYEEKITIHFKVTSK